MRFLYGGPLAEQRRQTAARHLETARRHDERANEIARRTFPVRVRLTFAGRLAPMKPDPVGRPAAFARADPGGSDES
jgi:hypothetical protein